MRLWHDCSRSKHTLEVYCKKFAEHLFCLGKGSSIVIARSYIPNAQRNEYRVPYALGAPIVLQCRDLFGLISIDTPAAVNEMTAFWQLLRFCGANCNWCGVVK